MGISKVIYNSVTQMDVTGNTVADNKILNGVLATAANGEQVTGSIANKTSEDLTVSGATVTAPAGYYAVAASKSVATTTHPNPTINLNTSTGVVTATHVQGTGYVTGGTTTATQSLSTQGAKTVTPTESEQTIVESGKYTTGNVTVGAIDSEYVGSSVARKTSSNLTASGATVTVPAGYYASGASKSVAGGSVTTPATTITSQPTMALNVDTGVVTATNDKQQSISPTVSAGYVSSGTAGTVTVNGVGSLQLPTQAATTITPSKTDTVTAVQAGKYTTGNVVVSPVQINLRTKTVDPSYETQIITADDGLYYSNIESVNSTLINSMYNFPIIWDSTPIVGNTYYMYFYFDRHGKSKRFRYDGEIVWNGYGTTFQPFYSYFTIPAGQTDGYFTEWSQSYNTFTINQNYIVTDQSDTDEDAAPYQATFKFRELSAYDGLSQVTVNPMPRNLVDMSWSKIKEYVNEGVDPSFLPIGTQINDKWTWQGTTYEAPWNVVHYNSQGMYLQWEYATPETMQFDAPEAIYYVNDDGLAAGTYYFSIGYTQSQWTTARHIQFTLAQACDPGDQFVLSSISTSNNPTASRTITVYGFGGTVAKQTATTSDGTSGTELGTFGAGGTQASLYYQGDGNQCNGIYWAIYGNHRWSQSAIRQWLNSDAAAGEWWQPMNPWDRPPSYAANRPGFLSGYSEEFKAILEPMAVVTVLDKVSGFEQATETTYDKVFLSNAWQLYSSSGVDFEGESWDYWKQQAENAGIQGMMYDTTEARNILKRYAINAQTSTSYVWLRSPDRSTNYVRNVSSSGAIVSSAANVTTRCVCPACIIKKSTPSYLDKLSDIDWTTIKKMTGTDLDIGAQIVDTWTRYNGTTYNLPWDVVHYDSDSIYLQTHYCLPDTMIFDEREALYYVGENGLAAGTYYISIGYTNSQWTTARHIQFTLTQACDPGDQFCINVTSASTDPTASKTITVYGFGETTAKQTATTSNGTDGTELGSTGTTVNDTKYKGNGNVNGTEWVFYGNHRWSQSAIRQWLNSDAEAGQWWTPMNPWDRPPAYAATMPGFLYGCTADFKSVLNYVPVKTLLDTVSGFTDTYDTTYDKIFLASVEQLYTLPDVYDIEGEPWEYYIQLAESAGIDGYMPLNNATANALRIKYRLDSTSSPVITWLRSPYRVTSSVCNLNGSGDMGVAAAYNAYRPCPACKISLIK